MVNSRSTRESSISAGRTWMPILPSPDRNINRVDRAQLAWCYPSNGQEANSVLIAPYEGMSISISSHVGMTVRITPS